VKQEITKALADGALLSVIGISANKNYEWFTFINEYAAGIGVILSVIFGVVASVFYWLTYRKKTKNAIEIVKLKRELSRIGDRESDDTKQ